MIGDSLLANILFLWCTSDSILYWILESSKLSEVWLPISQPCCLSSVTGRLWYSYCPRDLSNPLWIIWAIWSSPRKSSSWMLWKLLLLSSPSKIFLELGLAPRWLFGALWRLFRWLLHLLYFSSLTSEFLEAASKLLFGIGSCKGREGG